MINTVHDSIMFDCKKDILDYACSVIKEEMEDAPRYMNELYGIHFDLPLNVEITYGSNWKDQDTEYE